MRVILEIPVTYDDSLTFFGIYMKNFCQTLKAAEQLELWKKTERRTNLASIQDRKEAKERSNQDKKASQPASICVKGREEGCFEKKIAKAGKPEQQIQRRKGKF